MLQYNNELTRVNASEKEYNRVQKEYYNKVNENDLG